MPVIMLGGNPPGKDPTDVQAANLKLWFDASRQVYSDVGGTTPQTSDAGAVKSWKDVVSNFLVVESSSSPTLELNEVNGRQCVRFPTAGTISMSAAGAQTYMGAKNTAFLVWRPPASANIQRGVLFYDGVNANWGFYNGTSARLDNYAYDGTQDTVNKAATLDAWLIQSGFNDGTNLYIGVNDARTASMSSVASGNNTNPAVTFYFRSVPSAYAQTDIAEYIHYNTNLSEADRQDVERRLAWKYGITLPY